MSVKNCMLIMFPIWIWFSLVFVEGLHYDDSGEHNGWHGRRRYEGRIVDGMYVCSLHRSLTSHVELGRLRQLSRAPSLVLYTLYTAHLCYSGRQFSHQHDFEKSV